MTDGRKKEIRVEKVDSMEGFFLLREDWNRLLAVSGSDNYFLRWEWLYAWWKVYGESRRQLAILKIYRGEELIGIGPFYLVQRRWRRLLTVRRLMFLGTEEGGVTSEYMNLICRAGEEGAVTQAIIDLLAGERLCDEADLHNIESASETLHLLRQAARRRRFLVIDREDHCSPYFRLEAEEGAVERRYSRSLRRHLRNSRERLSRHTQVVYRKTMDLFELEKDFDELVRLHQLRWTSRRMPGSFSGGRFTAFQRRVMPEMLKNGHLELHFLSVSGRNIAALYNIKYRNKVYYFQSGLDTSFDPNLSPGVLLHDHCIRAAGREGLSEYDFLLQGQLDDYKQRWTKVHRTICDLYLARPGVPKWVMSVEQRAKHYLETVSRR